MTYKNMTMKKYLKYSGSIIILLFLSVMLVTSCKDFFDPEQEINITEEELYKDWYDYRSVAMGIYALQQNLVEQLVVLGELRGDLLSITGNADADLVEIYNFKVTKENKYASPENFFKLINACNNFIRIVEKNHPEVLDKKSEISNYDKIYGEALCMRAWAYFNASRIYGKVPYIPSSLATMNEVNGFVNSSGEYVDSVTIVFHLDGFHNDTIYKDSVTVLNKQYYDLPKVIEHFAYELENIKALGVDYTENNTSERTWQITTWNTFAWHALLGTMYLTEGNMADAADHFKSIIDNPNDEEYRYQLTDDFAGYNWADIFTQLDYREHIYTIYFDKDMQQQHDLLNLFLPFPPYQYMLKPTKAAVNMFESSWMGYTLITRTNPALTRVDPDNIGFPADPRGYGASFLYFDKGTLMPVMQEYGKMIMDKAHGNTRDVNTLMENKDTAVLKYFIGQDVYDNDMCFPIYRAGSIHLYLAEIYNYWVHWVPSNTGGAPTLNTELQKSRGLVNYGEYYTELLSRIQRGVRGRVGYSGVTEEINYNSIQYNFDPVTNQVTSFVNLGSNSLALKQRFEDRLLNERARECAFEGERFYDLMRVAKRRNDPDYLASRVSMKYPAGMREQIYNLLLDENNWYIHMFD